MKTKQENDLIDSVGVLYVENNTKLLWWIGLGVDYDVNQIGELHDWSFGCSLHRKRN